MGALGGESWAGGVVVLEDCQEGRFVADVGDLLVVEEV